MHHVFCVEAVVSELIQHYLIRREILGSRCRALQGILALNPGNDFIDSEQQSAFAKLAAMRAIFQMPDRRDRENEIFARIALAHIHEQR